MAVILVSSFGDGSPSVANATSAVAAASTGDTVLFPDSGSNTWSSSVTVSKAITIDVNNTALTAGALLTNGFFHVTSITSASLMRITRGVFDANDHETGGHCIRILNSVDLTQLRIDSNVFHFGNEALEVGGSKGVIDNNLFFNSEKAISYTAGSVTQANASWDSLEVGTSDALFIEDNSFIGDANYPSTTSQEAIGTYNGGKIVIRFNEFDFDNIANLIGSKGTIIIHGSAAGGVANGYWQQGTGARRGQSIIEIYENNMHGPRIDFPVVIRGGSSLIYNNIVGDVSQVPRIRMREEEYYETQWDPLRTAWPAEDQVHNTFVWDNTFEGLPLTGANFVVESGIEQDRDYWLHEPEASGGSESFTGSNGGSNTAPTDGITYPTLGNMTFSASGANAYHPYTPFTYPHPLATGDNNPKTGGRGGVLAAFL